MVRVLHLGGLGLGGREDGLDAGVEEDTTDGDAAAQHLDGSHGLPEDDSHAHNDDDALRRVGHGLGHAGGLLQGHGGKLVVSVEGKAGEDQVVTDDGVAIESSFQSL